DYSKLRGKIKEKFNTQDNFAKMLGIGRVSLSQRLNNQLEFSTAEILRAIKLLGLSEKDIPEYFFVQLVQKHEQTKRREEGGEYGIK
ncbi:MAG: DUF739 family protein, partial [Eubacterium sp.]|nr:DUF739 family protein [Eubacterium sp.]